MLSALIFELRRALRPLSSHAGFRAAVGVLASGLTCAIFMPVMLQPLFSAGKQGARAC